MPVWREKAVIPTKGRGASSSIGCDQLGKKNSCINLLLNIIRARQGLVTDWQDNHVLIIIIIIMCSLIVEG